MTSAQRFSPVALDARALTLRRGERMLFEALTFSLASGGALLVRGPNGAGKTSLLLTLAGALSPTRGSVDYRAGPEASLAADLHLLLPAPGIKTRLSVGENLTFWRKLNGPTGHAPAAALDAVGLGGLAAIEAGHLSTGQTRRLALARLLVSRRSVWLLDEPASALDADGETLVGQLVANHCAEGGIAVIATHHDVPALPAATTIHLGSA